MTLFGWAGADPSQVADANAYTMGTEFIANADVTITHVRVFSGATPTARPGRLGRIWSTAGLVLGQATMPTNLPSGWQIYPLDVPVSRLAGERFIVSFDTSGNYATISAAFDTAHNSADGALTARRAADAVNGNGVFNTTPGQFPASNFNNTFYGVDVGYDLGISGNTRPTINSTSISATDLAVSASISASDLESLAGATYTFEWGDGNTTLGASAGASHTYATGGLKAILFGVTDSGGLADYAAGAIVLVAPTVPGPLRPNDEIVTVAWLKSAVPYLGNRVATELPKDNTSWSASGFAKVSTLGGEPNIDIPVSQAVVSIDCYGASTNSGRPPWNLASQLAEQIKAAIWQHGTVPRLVTLPAAYASARVMTVIPRSEPRRVPDDVAAYARYTMDVEVWWVSP